MIQQDYFLRLIEEFAVALAKMLKVNLDKRDDALMDLYRQYVGDYTLVRNLSLRSYSTMQPKNGTTENASSVWKWLPNCFMPKQATRQIPCAICYTARLSKFFPMLMPTTAFIPSNERRKSINFQLF